MHFLSSKLLAVEGLQQQQCSSSRAGIKRRRKCSSEPLQFPLASSMNVQERLPKTQGRAKIWAYFNRMCIRAFCMDDKARVRRRIINISLMQRQRFIYHRRCAVNRRGYWVQKCNQESCLRAEVICLLQIGLAPLFLKPSVCACFGCIMQY